MPTSIREMKAKIKARVVWGTHCNPEVYEMMIRYSDKQVDKLADSIVLAFDNDTTSKRISAKHFNTAVVNLLLGDDEE